MGPSELRALVRDVPDYPVEGVVFKDVTPVLADPRALASLVELIAEPFRGAGVTRVAGIEARGFTLATPVALALGVGFAPFRKPGKLPYRVHAEEYQLEYGSDALQAHVDAIGPGERVLIVDDVVATGGTAGAAARLVRVFGAEVAGLGAFIELEFLNGREALPGIEIHTIVSYA